MNHFLHPPFSLAPLVALGTLACVGSTPSLAQPPDPQEKKVAYLVPEVEAAWNRLRTEVGSQEFTAPRETIARYQQFYEQKGFQSALTAMKISDVIAQLYWQGLDNRTKALDIYNWAVEQYGTLPQSERLLKQRDWLEANDSYRSTAAAAPVKLPAEKTSSAPGTTAPLTIKLPQVPSSANAAAPQIGIPNIGIPNIGTADTAAANIPAASIAVPGTIGLPTAPMPSAAPVAPSTLQAKPAPAPVSITAPPVAPVTVPVPIAPVAAPVLGAKAAPAPVSIAAPPASAPVFSNGVVLPGAISTGTGAAPPIAIPQFALPAPPAASPTALAAIEIAPGKIAPANPAAPPVAVSGVSGRMVILKGFVDQWRNGHLTWEQLREQTQLSPDDVRLLTSAQHGVSLSYLDIALREKVGETIAQMPELVERYRELSVPGQFALAQFYTSQRNPLAEVMFKELLESKLPREGAWSEEYLLEGLANYYKAVGDYKQAAQTQMRIVSITKGESWKGLSLIAAARFYVAAGNTEKADELYKQAQKSSFGWAAGMALYDQASQLIATGRHEQARQLLKTPFTGQHAEQMQIGMLILLGYSYFKTEDFEEARKYSVDAVARYGALKNPLQGENLEVLVEAAKDRLRIMDEWNDKGFERPLKKLLSKRDQGGVYHAKLYVHSLQKWQLSVSFKDNAAQLVALTLQSQRRADSGVMVTTYDLAYRTDMHSKSLQAQVTAPPAAQTQSIEVRHQLEDSTDGEY